MNLALLALLAVALGRGLIFAAGYLSSKDAFPAPLSEEEEHVALEAWRGGDEAARCRLVAHNLRLVAHVVKKFDAAGEDDEDLISIGTVGLIKAVDTFDLSRGIRLATYAARCIENEILMHLRAAKKNRGEVSLYDPIGVDREGNEITLLDVLGSDPDVVPDEVAVKFDVARLRQKLGRLGPRERQVLELRFGIKNGLRRTQREIARSLGISRSYVSRIEKRAVQKLQRELLPQIH